MTEYKTPWRLLTEGHLSRTGQILDSEGLLVFLINKEPAELARARRIVACVNFCVDIPTDYMVECIDGGARATDLMGDVIQEEIAKLRGEG